MLSSVAVVNERVYAAFALPVDDGYVDISIVLYALVVVVLHSLLFAGVFLLYFSFILFLIFFPSSFHFLFRFSVSVFFSTFQFVSRLACWKFCLHIIS